MLQCLDSVSYSFQAELAATFACSTCQLLFLAEHTFVCPSSVHKPFSQKYHVVLEHQALSALASEVGRTSAMSFFTA